jgi:pimeloyl-ACP methyl ester carboxylesterase
MAEPTDHQRRRLFGTMAMTLASLEGDANGAPHPEPASYAGKFSGRHAHRLIKGAGHNLPQEAPEAFVAAVVEVAGW